MPPREDGQYFRVYIVKMIDDHAFFYKNTLVTPSSYVLLIIINKNILFHTNTLPITLQTKRMK